MIYQALNNQALNNQALNNQAPNNQALNNQASIHQAFSIWTKEEQAIYQTIEDNLTSQFHKSYEERTLSLLSELSKLDISKENIIEHILKRIEDELGVKFTKSQKRAFTDALNEVWRQGQDYKNPETGNDPESLDFNYIARDFFQKTLKIDIGGQFKGTKNNFREAVEDALKTGDINTAIKSLEEKLLGKLDKDGKRINSELVNKVDWIVRDNVSRSRTFSRSIRMEQVGITRVQIIAILDQRTSHICKSLNGKTVELKTVNTYIKEFIADDPERAGFWNDRRNPTEAQTQALNFDQLTGDEILSHLGHKAPPYHPRCRTTLVASFDVKFKKATTIQEAEKFAKEGGIGKNVSYENLPLYVANQVNKTLFNLKEKYGTTYNDITTKSIREKIIRNGREENDIPIMKSSDTKLTINTEFFKILNTNSIDKINKILPRQKAASWMNSENLNDLIIHEFGHKLTAKSIKSEQIRLGKERVISDDFTTSEYSKKTDGEKLAEIFVLYNHGVSLNESFINIFNKYSEVKIK